MTFLERVSKLEPARVRAVWASVVALLLAVGVTVSTDIDGAVQAVIVAVFAVLPLVQGEATRRHVSPAGNATEEDFEVGDPVEVSHEVPEVLGE